MKSNGLWSEDRLQATVISRVHFAELYEAFESLVKDLGGFEAFDEAGFKPREVEIRMSPIGGRYSVTLLGELLVGGGVDSDSGCYEVDTVICRIKLAWEPVANTLRSVIPWRTMERHWSRLESRIRAHASSGTTGAALRRAYLQLVAHNSRLAESLVTELGLDIV